MPKEKLRIGFDAKRAFNNATGLGNYSRFVIRTLLTHYPQHSYFLFTPTIDPKFKDFVSVYPNARVITPRGLLGRSLGAVWRTYALTEEIGALDLDVYHGLSNELPVGIEKFRGRKVVTIHDLIFLRYPHYYSNIDRYIYTRKFKHACAVADIVAAASVQTRRDIEQYFQTPVSKLRVAYQDCDPLFAINVSNDDRQRILSEYNITAPYLLSVGTLEERKDQLTLLKAFAGLPDEKLQLVLVGKSTPYAARLQSFVQANRLDKRVHFLESVPFYHLPALYQGAAAFIYASEFEGFGIPVLEGLRSGVPVLAANASSLPEVGGEAAAYFEPHDVQGLGRLIGEALQSPRREAMISAGMRQAQHFNAGTLAAQLIELYQR